jgi:hypothetical protein
MASSCVVDRDLSSRPLLDASHSPRVGLSQDREISSIPEASDGNSVYPSEAQFFAATARKNHNPNAVDMKMIVPIDNAVNERALREIMKWEAAKRGDACGGVKLSPDTLSADEPIPYPPSGPGSPFFLSINPATSLSLPKLRDPIEV